MSLFARLQKRKAGKGVATSKKTFNFTDLLDSSDDDSGDEFADSEVSEKDDDLSVEDAMNLTPKPKNRAAPKLLPVDDVYSFTPSPSRKVKKTSKSTKPKV